MFAWLAQVTENPAQFTTVLKWIGASSGTTVALAGGYLLWTGKIVFRREFDGIEKQLKEALADRDEWKNMTMRLLQSTTRAVNASERSTSAAEQTVGTALAATPPADKT